jgi:hypothetical protein
MRYYFAAGKNNMLCVNLWRLVAFVEEIALQPRESTVRCTIPLASNGHVIQIFDRKAQAIAETSDGRGIGSRCCCQHGRSSGGERSEECESSFGRDRHVQEERWQSSRCRSGLPIASEAS